MTRDFDRLVQAVRALLDINLKGRTSLSPQDVHEILMDELPLLLAQHVDRPLDVRVERSIDNPGMVEVILDGRGLIDYEERD